MMDLLGDRIEVVREEGIGLGLSDMEIDLCMLAAIKELHQDANNKLDRKTGRPGRLCRCMRVMCYLGLGLTLLAGCAILVLSFSPSTQRRIERAAESYVYPATKHWRLKTLWLTNTFDLSSLYESECLVTNPFMEHEHLECENCAEVRRVHELEDIDHQEFEKLYANKGQPLVFRKYHSIVGYEQLQKWFEETGEQLEKVDSKLRQSPRGIATVGDLIMNHTEKEVKQNKDFVALWDTKSVNPSRLLRKLFPRQNFIPAKAEVNLMKTLIVTSPEYRSFGMDWDTDGIPNQWYVQGSGSRSLTLDPNGCEEECKPVSLTMAAGDVLFYSPLSWIATSHPGEEGDDVNVAFIGQFSIM